MACLEPESLRAYTVAPAVFYSEMVDDVLSTPLAKDMGAKTQEDWAGFNPVFPGVASPGRFIGMVLHRLISGGELPFKPGSIIVVDGVAAFSAQDFYDTIETREPTKINLQKLYNVDLEPMPLQEESKQALVEELKALVHAERAAAAQGAPKSAQDEL